MKQLSCIIVRTTSLSMFIEWKKGKYYNNKQEEKENKRLNRGSRKTYLYKRERENPIDICISIGNN